MLANCYYHNDDRHRRFPQHRTQLQQQKHQHQQSFLVADARYAGRCGGWYDSSAVGVQPSAMFSMPPIGNRFYPSVGATAKTTDGYDRMRYGCGNMGETSGRRDGTPIDRFNYRHDGDRFTVPPRDESIAGVAASTAEYRSFSPTSTTSDGRTCVASTSDDWPFDELNGNCSAATTRRNERERNRVRTINQTFTRLRQHLPASLTSATISAAAAAAAAAASKTVAVAGSSAAVMARQKESIGGVQSLRSTGRYSADEVAAIPRMKSKKLSKVQILRAAIEYIAHLQRTLSATGTACTDETDDEERAGADRSGLRLKWKSEKQHQQKQPKRSDEVPDGDMKPSLCLSGDRHQSPTTTANSMSSTDLTGSLQFSGAERIAGYLGCNTRTDTACHFRSASFRSSSTEGATSPCSSSSCGIKFEISTDCSDVTCDYGSDDDTL